MTIAVTFLKDLFIDLSKPARGFPNLLIWLAGQFGTRARVPITCCVVQLG